MELLGCNEVIFYEVDGVDLPELEDLSFAVWHVLPLAMKEGVDFHVDGPVDPAVLRNARRISRIWELWQPQRFREVTITSASEAEAARPKTGVLTMYSGGIDSTYMLMKLGRQPTRSAALTVHGMDYAHEKPEGFANLLNQTAEILNHFNYYRITSRSNANRIAKGDYAWGMALAGHAFCFQAFSKAPGSRPISASSRIWPRFPGD